MKKYALIPFFLLSIHFVHAQIPADSIKAIIEREVANKRGKSIIVGIVGTNGKQIFSAGRISDQHPALPDVNTIYEIGSITKVFTSLLLAEMSLKKQVQLNDPISKYLPKAVKTPVRNGKEISLLHLSTHRSGFPRNAWNIDPKNLDNPYADYKADDLYKYISSFELSRDIDSKWQYSNIAYALLGQILSIAAHKNFETLMKDDIYKPLHMNSTSFVTPQKPGANVAQGYTESGIPASKWDLPLAGGGGMRSTMNDMLAFAAANLGLVKTDLYPAIELSHQQQAKKDGTDYYMSLGWTIWNQEGREILFKDGGTGGYSSFLGIDKKNKVGVVILINSTNLVTDIGLHILDSTYKLSPYQYRWALLDTLRTTIKVRGITAGIELYQQLKAANDPAFNFNEKQLNYLGNELRKEEKIKDAIRVYELNAKEYPASALVYESLAETYKRNNEKTAAIQYFKKAMEVDPQNPHWAWMIQKLQTQ